MIKIKIPDVQGGVLNTEFGNGNLGKKYRNSVSFPIKWSKVKGARSYCVTLIDYEASGAMGVVFVHWIAANIKKNKLKWDDSFNQKAQIAQFENSVTDKASMYLLEAFYQEHPNGVYYGPFPPDTDHNYRLEVYALDVDDIFHGQPHNGNGLFYDDFLELIKNNVIDYGITSFLYRSRTEFKNQQLIEKNLTPQQLSAPLSQDIEFFKSFDQINFSSHALSARANDYHLLNIDFLGRQGASGLYSARSFDLEIYCDNQQVVEYVVLVSSFAEVNSLGVGLINWVKVGIEKNQNHYKTRIEAQKDSWDSDTDEIKISNSFDSLSAAKIAQISGFENAGVFDFVKQGYGIIYFPLLTNGQGKYVLEIFGIDEKIDWKQLQSEKTLNAADVLRAIKAKVVAYNKTIFKLL
ncbi:Phospholipid-binding protein [Mesomycoplasma conjunctivae]|uniref:Phospholipid-binding protein n=1 Tax=Mesomycoplasma conjunctivae (strain ATCC 25834 / NCTC 10147 / HRC/581) TaxID=572263 RepID=C5J664_MESCH|nr:YbhB/YbcL family Raf kinase inhibitor-like protein [Mesomycoplasma conjunctivae]CAT04956.1 HYPOTHETICAL PROTEIN MCJ_002650 [Mesomycoplasma conjunctivae]VEU66117.1 Phospholipid-binding protein [Mesomycoplasma conjunctivae]